MNKKLPIYKLTIKKDDTESGVSAIALVKQPAIEIDFFAFKSDSKPKFEFKAISPDKQLLAGYLMVPNKLIYRRDEKTNDEYFVQFDSETVELIAEKFNRNLMQSNFNVEHNSNNQLQGVFVKENWIVESEEFDKCKTYGFDAIVGGWFCIAKVQDTDKWNEFVKTGKVQGFSIEGHFEMEFDKIFNEEFQKLIPQSEIKITAGLQKVGSGNIYTKQESMKKLKFGLTATLQDGTKVSLDEFAVGGILSIVGSDGTATVAPDGDYIFEDGTVACVEGGVITAITPASETEPEEMANDAPATDAPASEAEDVKSDTDLITEIKALSEAISKLQSDLKAGLDALTAEQSQMKKDFAAEKNLVNDKFNAVQAKSILETGSTTKVEMSFAEKAMETINAFKEAKAKK